MAYFEHIRISRLLFFLVLSALILSCSQIFPPAPQAHETLDGPMDGLSPEQKLVFLEGDRAFNEEIFFSASGLGPYFVSNSCVSCHAADGKGHPFTTLVRFGQTAPGEPANGSIGGPQLQNKALPGYHPETLPEGTPFMKILPPAVTGLGLLAALTDSQIMANADPSDANGDGISGVPNFISPPPYFEKSFIHDLGSGAIIGRFGKKAAVADLLQQVVSAYNQDMGITSFYEPKDPVTRLSGDYEVSLSTINAIVFYLRVLRAPVPRDQENPEIIKGKELFTQINCSGCHTPQWTSPHSDLEVLSNVTFYPYTDLLLHDMGPGLDDGVTEGNAETYEWRTPALWGIGLSSASQGGNMFLMHDGRANTIDQAIQLHGGEATKSKDAFNALNSSDQAAIVNFIMSL